MKALRWVVVACSALCALAPFVQSSVPAKYAALAAAALAVVGTLKVEAGKLLAERSE